MATNSRVLATVIFTESKKLMARNINETTVAKQKNKIRGLGGS